MHRRMKMMDYQKIFSDIFMEENSENSNEYKICQRCFPVLLELDSAEIFEQFFIQMEEYILNNDTQLLEEEKTKIAKINSKYSIFLDGILETLIKEDASKDIFYEKLWNSIKNMPLCDDESDKAGILYILCRNDLIPYYKAEGVDRIEKEELWEIIDMNTTNIIAARSIIKQYAMVEDRVKYASILLKLLEQCSGDKDRAVVISYIIKFVELNAIEEMKKQLLEKIKANH